MKVPFRNLQVASESCPVAGTDENFLSPLKILDAGRIREIQQKYDRLPHTSVSRWIVYSRWMGKIASENLKNALINQFDPEDARKASQSTALERFAYELQASSFVFGLPGTG